MQSLKPYFSSVCLAAITGVPKGTLAKIWLFAFEESLDKMIRFEPSHALSVTSRTINGTHFIIFNLGQRRREGEFSWFPLYQSFGPKAPKGEQQQDDDCIRGIQAQEQDILPTDQRARQQMGKHIETPITGEDVI